MALNKYNRPFFGFNDFPFSSIARNDPFDFPMMQVIPSFTRPEDMLLRHCSPGYEFHETDDKYHVAVDVPGIKASDMTVDLEDNGNVLSISGARKVTKNGESSETKFVKRFTIGSNIDIDKLTANLSDGVLVLTAPKKQEDAKQVRKVTIVEGPAETK
jgi:HSP20 family protein